LLGELLRRARRVGERASARAGLSEEVVAVARLHWFGSDGPRVFEGEGRFDEGRLGGILAALGEAAAQLFARLVALQLQRAALALAVTLGHPSEARRAALDAVEHSLRALLHAVALGRAGARRHTEQDLLHAHLLRLVAAVLAHLFGGRIGRFLGQLFLKGARKQLLPDVRAQLLQGHAALRQLRFQGRVAPCALAQLREFSRHRAGVRRDAALARLGRLGRAAQKREHSVALHLLAHRVGQLADRAAREPTRQTAHLAFEVRVGERVGEVAGFGNGRNRGIFDRLAERVGRFGVAGGRAAAPGQQQNDAGEEEHPERGAVGQTTTCAVQDFIRAEALKRKRHCGKKEVRKKHCEAR